jgi:hypothetical protein
MLGKQVGKYTSVCHVLQSLTFLQVEKYIWLQKWIIFFEKLVGALLCRISERGMQFLTKLKERLFELMKGDPIIIAVAQQAPAPHHRQLL